MNAASQVPSSVLISTFFSVTGMSAADALPAAAAMPAPIEIATNSRRDSSLRPSLALWSALWSRTSSAILSLLNALADPAIVSDSNPTRRRQTRVSQERPMSMHPVGRREFLMTMAAAGAAGFVRVEAAYDPAASFDVAVSEVEFRRNAGGRMLMARIYQ